MSYWNQKKPKDFNIKFNSLITIACEIAINIDYKLSGDITINSIKIYIQKSSSHTVSEGSDELLPLLGIQGLSVNF